MGMIAVIREEVRLVRKYDCMWLFFSTLTLSARRFAPRLISPDSWYIPAGVMRNAPSGVQLSLLKKDFMVSSTYMLWRAGLAATGASSDVGGGVENVRIFRTLDFKSSYFASGGGRSWDLDYEKSEATRRESLCELLLFSRLGFRLLFQNSPPPQCSQS